MWSILMVGVNPATQASEYEIKNQFHKFLVDQGLNVIFNDLKLDGKRHWVTVSDRSEKKKNKKSGWYQGFLNGINGWPVGLWGNLHTGKDWKSEEKWLYTREVSNLSRKPQSSKPALSKQQIAQIQRKELVAKKRENRLNRARLGWTQAMCRIEYDRATAVQNHPYLTAKNISPGRAKLASVETMAAKAMRAWLQRGLLRFEQKHGRQNSYILPDKFKSPLMLSRFNTLLIAVERIDGKLESLQTINNRGDKWFIKNIPKSDKCHLLGASLNEHVTAIGFCEGWSTGRSVEVLSHGKIPIVVCWDKSNLLSMASQCRALYPDVKFYFFADNDHENERTPPHYVNDGIHYASMAAQAVGHAKILVPPFEPHDKKLSDWNDLVQLIGFSSARNTLRQLLTIDPHVPLASNTSPPIEVPIQSHDYDNFQRSSIEEEIYRDLSQKYLHEYAGPVSEVESPEMQKAIQEKFNPVQFTSWLLATIELKKQFQVEQSSATSTATTLLQAFSDEKYGAYLKDKMNDIIHAHPEWSALVKANQIITDHVLSARKTELDVIKQANRVLSSALHEPQNLSKMQDIVSNSLNTIEEWSVDRIKKNILNQSVRENIGAAIEPHWAKELFRICDAMVRQSGHRFSSSSTGNKSEDVMPNRSFGS